MGTGAGDLKKKIHTIQAAARYNHRVSGPYKFWALPSFLGGVFPTLHKGDQWKQEKPQHVGGQSEELLP